MSFIELLLLDVALSMDAFAVSVTNGMTLGSVPLRYAFAVSLTFGAFQAFMPLIGFFGGSFFTPISKRSITGSCSYCSEHSAVG